MAEDEQTEDSEKGGGLNKGLIIALVVIILGIGGYAGMTMFGDSEEVDDVGDAGAEPRMYGPLVPMRPIVANLADPETTRYIKITCHLEVVDEEAAAELELVLPPIRNRMLVYLTGLRAEDAQGPENQERHRAGLLNAINSDVFREDRVTDLYFTEYVVQ